MGPEGVGIIEGMRLHVILWMERHGSHIGEVLSRSAGSFAATFQIVSRSGKGVPESLLVNDETIHLLLIRYLGVLYYGRGGMIWLTGAADHEIIYRAFPAIIQTLSWV